MRLSPILRSALHLILALACTVVISAYTPVDHGTLIAAQGTISYSILTSADDRKHTWTIDIPNASKLLIVFSDVHMYSAEVQVAQTLQSGTNDIFFNCSVKSSGLLIYLIFEDTYLAS